MLTFSGQLIHESFSKCIKLGTGRVHSCYHRVLNILTEDGLFSILSAEIACAPKALQLMEPVDFLKMNILVGHQVSFFDSHLSIGNKLTIDLSSARLWHCPIIFPADTSAADSIAGIASANELFLRDSERRGAAVWYREQLGKNISMTEDSIDLALRIRIGDFVCGWFNGNLAPVERLVGVGYGLTPSGDDFLCGFYFALSHLLPENTHVIMLRIQILSLSVQMSDISRQMIDTYFNGEGNEVFYRFLSAVLQNDIDVLPAIYREILMFGSTSGIDITVGILTGLSFVFPSNSNKRQYQKKRGISCLKN